MTARSWRWAACAALVASSFALRAPAQSPEPSPPAPSSDPAPRLIYTPGAPVLPDLERHEDEVAERRRTGKRFHDGFYLRLGVGAGYLISSSTASDSSQSDVDARGFTVPVELAIGGAPIPGFVLGAGSWSSHVPVATYSAGSGDSEEEEDGSYGSIWMLGPFADVYPAPRSGLHFQVAPCLALVNPGSSDTIVPESLSGAGFGAMAGLGYEAWMADQWGLGVLLRAQFAYVELSDDWDNHYDFLGVMPGLLLTATFN